MFETGIRQLRMAWSMLRGAPISPRNPERLVADARATPREFGVPGRDVEQLLDGPFADPAMRRHLQDTSLRRTVTRAAPGVPVLPRRADRARHRPGRGHHAHHREPAAHPQARPAEPGRGLHRRGQQPVPVHPLHRDHRPTRHHLDVALRSRAVARAGRAGRPARGRAARERLHAGQRHLPGHGCGAAEHQRLPAGRDEVPRARADPGCRERAQPDRPVPAHAAGHLSQLPGRDGRCGGAAWPGSRRLQPAAGSTAAARCCRPGWPLPPPGRSAPRSPTSSR